MSVFGLIGSGRACSEPDQVRERGSPVSAAWRYADCDLVQGFRSLGGFAPWVAVVDGAPSTVSSRRSHIIWAFSNR